jgi:membrane-bound lytic murein transglycosylase MltF
MIIILIGIWQFNILKKNYNNNIVTVLAKINTMELELKEYVEINKKVEAPIVNESEDLKNYISTKFPKVHKKDVKVIVKEVTEQCSKHDIPVSVVASLIEAESSFKKDAKSEKGARGLMQVRHNVWGKHLGIKKKSDLYDIEINIAAGVEILRHYIDKNKGDITKALQNYSGYSSKGTKFSNRVYKSIGQYTLFCSLYKSDSKSFYIAKGKDWEKRDEPGETTG